MNIDLSRFIDEDITSLPIEGELNLEHIEMNGRNINFIEPINYKGNIYRVGTDKFLDVDINYTYSEQCGRCLETFVKSGKTDLTGELIIGSEDDYEFNENEEAEEIIFYNGEILDLTNDVRSMVLLDLPMKPICREDCEGLCPVCGLDRNKEKCDCVIDTIDPRLAKLKEFFPED